MKTISFIERWQQDVIERIPRHCGLFEGPNDTGIEFLYFWDEDDKIVATAFSMACPAQRAGSRFVGL